jgi:hypothetical protein
MVSTHANFMYSLLTLLGRTVDLILVLRIEDTSRVYASLKI